VTPSSFALSWNGTACDWSLPMLCQIELPVAGFRSNQETSDTSLMDCELPLMSVECNSTIHNSPIMVNDTHTRRRRMHSCTVGCCQHTDDSAGRVEEQCCQPMKCIE